MSNPINDGGPAFPYGQKHITERSSEGMSLRAWLAGHALQGLLANPGGPIQANGMSGWGYTNCSPDQVAHEAVFMADALLAALSRKEAV